MMDLIQTDREELENGSAISPDQIGLWGFASISKKEAPTYGFKRAGLLMPFKDVHGNEHYQLKPYEPIRNTNGKPRKYESPAGKPPVLAMSEASRQHIGNPEIPLMLTEGIKKQASAESHGVQCTIGVQGVYNWRGKNADGGVTVLPDWECIALNEREVLLAFDSDLTTNRQVQRALQRLKRFLESRGAIVRILVLPDLPDGAKCGLDDWFASGGTLEDLRQYVQDTVPTVEVDPGDQAPYSDSTYRADDTGFWRVGEKDGDDVFNRLTDWTAWVVEQCTHPEAPELNYSEIVLRRNGRVYGPVRVLDRDFRQVDGRNGWLGAFGSAPRVWPGASNAHLVNAIQVASGSDVIQRTVFDRIGWACNGEGEWSYLTSAGALGADGLDTSIRVEPGGRLADYQLQDAGDLEAVRNAVRIACDVETVARTEQGMAAVYASLGSMLRSLLIPARRQNFTTTIVGETGSGKSGIAGLLLQMFGPEFGYDHLTDNWGSTLNSILDIASRARHAPLVIDDYVEIDTGGSGIGRQAHSRDTLIRLVANSAPKNRLKADATRNDGSTPETGLISTQETTGSFTHQSEKGRQVYVRVAKRGAEGADLSIDEIKRLSREYGRTGIYNLAISGYVRSLASGMNELIERMDELHDNASDALSKRMGGLNLHERTLPALADIAIGWDAFISYALRIDAIDREEASMYREKMMLSLVRIAQDQAEEQDADRPELIIVELLQEMFGSRQITLRDRLTDDRPDSPIQMGWKSQTRETYDGSETTHTPAGREIGWVDSEFVYLMPKPTAQALQAVASASRHTLPAGERQIGAVLVRSGIATPGESGKNTRLIEVGASTASGGTRKRALRIPREILFPELVPANDAKPGGNVTSLRREVA